MEEILVYQQKYSIPDRLCSDIITMYELENIKFEGSTIGGVQKDVKDTTDLIIPKHDVKWSKIESFLYEELSKGLAGYIQQIDIINTPNSVKNYKHFNDLQVDNFMIQKYDKQQGKYIYHNDYYADHILHRERVITFLWYLNTVDEGGETEFWGGKFFIKPEVGKLLLFPASWTFPHRGKVPISNDKYIITGWFYEKK
jgi:hypothetical protein